MHNRVSRRTILRLLSGAAALALVPTRAVSDTVVEETFKQTVIDSWHAGQTDIEARAIANLESVSAGISLSPRSNPDGGAFIAVSTTDGYDAARLLLPQFMRRVREAPNATLIFAGISNRDFLVAWTPDLAPRRGFANKIVQDFQSRPHPLTDALFTSNDTGVRLADAAALRDHGR